MPQPTPDTVRLPPRWFLRLFWSTHRRPYRWTGGRLGPWRPKARRWASRSRQEGRRNQGRHTASDDEVTAELETAGFAASDDEDDKEQRHQDDEQHNPPTPG